MKKKAAVLMVNLHIYDVVGNVAFEYMNNVFRMLGTGAFHVAIEVFGDEWSYGFSDDSPGCTGLFNCAPGENKDYGHHRETILLGTTPKPASEVDEILDELRKSWKGEDYDLLHHNCCHFSDAFARLLGVGGIPAWVLSLANTGGSITDGVWQVVDTPKDALFKLAKSVADLGHSSTGDSTDEIQKGTSGGKLHVSKLDKSELIVNKSSARTLGTERRLDEIDGEAKPPRRCCCLSSKKGSS